MMSSEPAVAWGSVADESQCLHASLDRGVPVHADRAAMILRIFHTLPAERRISMEVYASELIQALAGLSRECILEHWFPAGRFGQGLQRFGPLARLAGWADRYDAYQRSVRGQDGDVNHLIDHGYGHLAFSLKPNRTVVTFHDAMLLKLEARELPTQSYPRLTILGHKWSLRAIARVARVIAVSDSSRKDFLRFTDYPPERVRVIPNGVSTRFQPPASPRLRRENEEVRVLHVGHCGPYKNIEGILHALPLVEKYLAVPVVFEKIGGALTASQETLARALGVADRMRYRGVVPAADLPAAYAAADVLLQPSLYEGFGLTALEAMACGTPVVVSNAGSLPEVVGDAGLVVPPTDAEAIARAVVRAVTDAPLRAKLRERGFERARAFSWERTAAETLAVYQEIYEETH